MKNILFFGNSLTAGYGLGNPSQESYPALIQKKINTLGLSYHVINGGSSGDTTAGGLSRLSYWLNREIDVFVLELGINDIIRGVQPKQIEINLQQIINAVKIKYPRAKIALMGMQVPEFIMYPFAKEFNTVFSELARTNRITILPSFLAGVAGQSHLNLPDKLHPSSKGYEIIAENVWKVIFPLINDAM